jgi:hypothetical protein
MFGRYRHILAIAALLFGGPSWAADVSLAWNPSPSAGVLGYRIHYGTASGQYSTVVDVGNVLTATIPGFAENGTTYYFAATAYGDPATSSPSGFSNEVFKTLGTCPCSQFTAADAPTQAPDADATPVTLGVKFTSSVAGQITAIKFYAAAAGAGDNTYQLWGPAGAALASKTLARPAAAGWTTVTFDVPVQIQAGQEYTASVWLSNATYYGDDYGFNDPKVGGPLTAATSAGVYVYGATPQKPFELYQNENYWVDVVFTTTGTPPTMPVPTNLRITQ